MIKTEGADDKEREGTIVLGAGTLGKNEIFSRYNTPTRDTLPAISPYYFKLTSVVSPK